MGTGIIICGLNGTGKSTLGKALAAEMHFYFIDDEALYFPKTSSHNIYAFSRTREEVEKLLFEEIKAHENFVFTSVKGDYGETIRPFFQYSVLMEVPKDIRLRRVVNRSFQNLAIEYYWVEIYMSRRKVFLILLNPEKRKPLKNGHND